MNATADQLYDQALDLEPEDRRQLAERLWESVEPAPADLTDEQKAMLDRRWEEIASGKVECRPVKDLIAEMRQKYVR